MAGKQNLVQLYILNDGDLSVAELNELTRTLYSELWLCESVKEVSFADRNVFPAGSKSLMAVAAHQGVERLRWNSSPIMLNIIQPATTAGWNWSAFLLPPLWVFAHGRIKLALLSLVPVVNWGVRIYLGVKGNEIA